MLKIDAALLAKLGLEGMPASETDLLLRQIYETLESRVGNVLGGQMTSAQLDEFQVYVDAKDDKGALKWLEANFPHYKAIVASEFEGLQVEIREVADTILEVITERESGAS